MVTKSVLGIAFMVLAMQTVTGTDIFAKFLLENHPQGTSAATRFFSDFLRNGNSENFSAVLISWWISVWMIVALLPIVVARHTVYTAKAFKQPSIVLRGLLAAVVGTAFFFAIDGNPIPDTLAISFISPFAVAVFAAIFLKERFNWKYLVATAVGFGGILIVLRPGGGSEYSLTILFALVAGVCNGGFVVSTRFIGNKVPISVLLFLTSVWVLIFTTPLAIPLWVAPTWQSVLVVGGSALCILVSQFFLIKAVAFAEASMLAPFLYTEIVGATVISWLVFGMIPDIWVFVGFAVIAVSGTYVMIASSRRQITLRRA